MKRQSFWKPVQDWFKAVGAVGKQHHASQVEPSEEPKLVIPSPRKKQEQKPKK